MNTTTIDESQPKSQAAAKVLTRDELANIKNLFLLDPDNRAFVLGAQEHLANNSYLVPVLFLLGGLAALIVPASVLSGSPLLWRIGGLIGMLFGVVAVLGTRRSIRDEKKGQFLQVKLTAVSIKERTAAGQATAQAASFVGGLVEDVVSKQNHYHRGPDDFYEIHLDFAGTTPSGAPLVGKISRNRPDLRGKALPQAGNAGIVMYVTDTDYTYL